jgi:hypothetical protein
VQKRHERFYESRRVMWLDDLQRDVRFAVRALLRSRGFTAVAVLTLAVGIGANTAIFSLLNTLMLRSLPVRQPEQLVEMVFNRAARRARRAAERAGGEGHHAGRAGSCPSACGSKVGDGRLCCRGYWPHDLPANAAAKFIGAASVRAD